RSIRSKDRLLFDNGVNRRIHLLLFLNVLDDGLNHNVAIGQVSLVSTPLKPGKSFGLLLRSDSAFLGTALGKLTQRLLNPGKPLVEILLFDFEHGSFKPSSGADLRNTRPHQPAT